MASGTRFSRNVKRGYGTEQGLQHLACEHTPEISLYAETGNGEKDEQQPQQEAEYAEQKSLDGLADAV